MTRITGLSAILLLWASAANLIAQKELTLRDAVLKAGTDLAPRTLKGLQWIPDAAGYAFLKGDSLMMGSVGKAADQLIATVADLNAKLEEDAKLKAFPSIEWESASAFRFFHKDRLFIYDRAAGSLTARNQFPEDAENHDVAPEGGSVAYTQGRNLFVAPANSTKHIQVTRDSLDGHVNGVSVHRQEYGIVKGTFWSPKGNLLAFYNMDESMVTTYQLEQIGTKPSTFTSIRYPMAGQASHHVRIGVFDARTQRTIFLQTGEPADQYLTNIAWSPDERNVFVVHLDRETENLRVVQYDVKTGSPVRTLFEEHSDIYLEPEHPQWFLEKSPGRFIWWSERDGWQHLYLYDLKAGMIRQLTEGPWVVKEILGTDEKESHLFVEGSGADPTETHLYRVHLATGETVQLTRDPGTHHGLLSSNGRTLIDQWSSVNVPARTDLLDARSGSVMKTLVDATEPLDAFTTGTIDLFTIEGENGVPLHARMIKPSGFDPARKYPVLVYLYNGPHVQLVTNSRLGGASLWMLHAAERGSLVFTVDGRGSENRGRDFEQAVHRRLGEVEIQDQLRGVAYLKTLPYVDPDRLAVHGWSFGGFMTTGLMVKAPGTFKVGVAGGPVMDWAMYEVMYTERYMDTPEENPDGYAGTANVGRCGDLQGDLLIILGNQDDVVLPEHSLAFLKDCVDKDRQVDFFVYPGHGHNVRGKDRLHLMTKVLDYIDEKLR